MAFDIKRVEYYNTTVEGQAGEASKLLSLFADVGVSLLAFKAVPLDLFDTGILEPEMTASELPGLISLLSGHDRVWLVYSHDSYTDPMGLVPQTLASQMKLTRTRDFYGGQVQLYVNP